MAESSKASTIAAIESRREREVFRYIPGLFAPLINADALTIFRYVQAFNNPMRVTGDGSPAVSSSETALTAYAQLVALRMSAKRVLVSLIDKQRQVILTEATQTLSLRTDHGDSPSDDIIFGSSIIPRAEAVCKRVVNHHSATGRGGTEVVIPDLRLDDELAQHQCVVTEPFARAYIGIPILSASGFALGTLAVLDDKPRPAFSDTDRAFMKDIASTIMGHLEMMRIHVAHQNSLRMIKGLSLFIEGKHSFDSQDTSLNETTHNGSSMPATEQPGASVRTQTFNKASIVQDNTQPQHPEPVSQGPHRAPAEPSPDSRPGTSSESSQNKGEEQRVSNAKDQTDARKESDEAQEALLSPGVRRTFERAGRIVREAMDMDGALFLDASIARFGGLGDVAPSTTSFDTFASAQTGSDSLPESHSDRANPSDTTSPQSSKSTKTNKICRTLGIAMNSEASKDGNGPQGTVQVTESYLKSLMRRFPYGKIWNFDEDGFVSSDGKSDSNSAASTESAHSDETAKAKARSAVQHRRRKRGSDSSKILEIFPGARCVVLMPLWDAHRERNFACSFLWTHDPYRILSFQEDLSFLAAFCDCVMAEVARLDAQVESRMKTTFMSSMSHELRSPLHGIMGALEVLHDNESAALSSEMLQMIGGCGRSLIDIIDHLVDHAHITSPHRKTAPGLTTSRGKDSRQQRMKFAWDGVSNETVCDIASVTEEVMDAALWSTPKSIIHKTGEHTSGQSRKNAPPLKVIFDLQSDDLEDDWKFQISGGAWRRMVLNLVVNAIKYTDPGGYVKLTLSRRPERPENLAADAELIEIACTDNGRGMGQEYLNSGLWKAFSQEDGHAEGTGLGLSIVHRLVNDLRGKIAVESTKGLGTTISLILPLARPTSRPGSLSQLDQSLPPKSVSQGRSIYLHGFDRGADEEKRLADSTQVLRTSVEKLCQETLGMRVVTGSESASADFYLLSEEAAIPGNRKDTPQLVNPEDLEKRGVVLCNSALSAQSRAEQLHATVVSQPLSARKLLKAFRDILDKQIGTDGALEGLEVSANDTRAGLTASPAPIESTPAPEEPQVAPSVPEHKINLPSRPHFPRMVSSSHRRASSTTSIARPVPSTAPAITSPISVLLVEDNKINLRLLQTHMTKFGCHYLSANDGLEALEMYKEAHRLNKQAQIMGGTKYPPPSVILMDITMPRMDGYDSSRNIREHERSLGIQPATIVALTALSSPDARQKAFSCGINDWLTKPVRMQELRGILDTTSQNGPNG